MSSDVSGGESVSMGVQGGQPPQQSSSASTQAQGGRGRGVRQRQRPAAPPEPGQVDAEGLMRYSSAVDTCTVCGRYFYMAHVLLRLRRVIEYYGGAATVSQLMVAFGDKAVLGEILGEAEAEHTFGSEKDLKSIVRLLNRLVGFGVLRRTRQRGNSGSVYVLPDVFDKAASDALRAVEEWASSAVKRSGRAQVHPDGQG